MQYDHFPRLVKAKASASGDIVRVTDVPIAGLSLCAFKAALLAAPDVNVELFDLETVTSVCRAP